LAKSADAEFDVLVIVKKGYKKKIIKVKYGNFNFGIVVLEKCETPDDYRFYETLADVFVTREGYNVGLGSDIKFCDIYTGGYMLFKFNIDELPSWDYEAYLRLFAMMPMHVDYKFEIEIFKSTHPWEEGRGHWYWYDGRKSNGYDRAYMFYPDYTPPKNTQNPAYAEGIRWDRAGDFLSNLTSIRNDSMRVRYYNGVFRTYPLFQRCAYVNIDVTDAVQSGEFTIVLRSLDPDPVTSVHVYSKDHVPGWPVPEIVLIKRAEDGSLGDLGDKTSLEPWIEG
jgi:hypothetical protein